jgi:hypothetical protein
MEKRHMRRFAYCALFLVLCFPSPSTAATGCGSRPDSLFAQAETDYTAGNYINVSADMQEAASDYYACAKQAKVAGNTAKQANYAYFYGQSLYVAGEAEGKLHHTAKVKELWSASLSALRPLGASQYLTPTEQALVAHAVSVMTPVVKILNQN